MAEISRREYFKYYGVVTDCHAQSDGDCEWKDCPQLRDKEPESTGRHCPLDVTRGDEMKESPYAYVNKAYGLAVKPGDRVVMSGRHGVVVRKAAYDHYVHVKFDGTKFDVPCHPMALMYAIPEVTK